MEGINIAKLLKPADRTLNGRKILLIGEGGEQFGTVTIDEAREKAKDAGLDLVVVSDKGEAAVCKLMDFGKLQYERKKNIKAQRKGTSAQKQKEIKFHVRIDTHDYEYKMKRGIEFLTKGCKLKVSLMFRGREMAHKDMGFELINKIIEELKPYATADNRPKMTGRNIVLTFSPLSKKNR
jgi:translation initiation factor IF-3